MPISPEKKRFILGNLQRIFKTSNIVVAFHQNSLTLRPRLPTLKFYVAKGSLVRHALKGTVYENAGPLFHGPTVIGYADDPTPGATTALKEALDLVKPPSKKTTPGKQSGDTYTLLGGVVDGKVYHHKDLMRMADLGSLQDQHIQTLQILENAMGAVNILSMPSFEILRNVSALEEWHKAGQPSADAPPS